MQKLSEQLSRAHEFTSAEIYANIKENILPHVHASDCPPPDLIIFTARRLSEPSMRCEDIPTILELLANVEAIRKRAVNQARTALELQQKFSGSRESRLKKSDEKKLKSIADEEMDQSIRLILRESVVLNLCRLHICHLWISPDSYTILKVMKKYFPSNYVGDGDLFADAVWRGQLHHDLTRAERERVHAVGEEMKAFLLRAKSWDLERETYFKKLGLEQDVIFGENEFISYPRDFNAKFRAAIDEKGMTEALIAYLKEVLRMVTVLEKLFPSTKQQAESAARALIAQESTGQTG